MLQVREQQHHSTSVITLTGLFTHHTTEGIQAKILASKKMDYQHIILDFSGITKIDTKGLGVLLDWYHNRKPYYVQVSIVKPPTSIWNQLDLGHISEYVPIYASQEEATWNNLSFSLD